MSVRILIVPMIAVGLLAGCTASEQSRARDKAHEAGQELKKELKDVAEQAKEAGSDLKKELKEAGTAAQRGMEHAKDEIRKGIPDKDEPRPRKP